MNWEFIGLLTARGCRKLEGIPGGGQHAKWVPGPLGTSAGTQVTPCPPRPEGSQHTGEHWETLRGDVGKLGDIQGHSGNPQAILYVPIERFQDTGGHMGTLGDPRDMEGLPQANPCPHRGVPGWDTLECWKTLGDTHGDTGGCSGTLWGSPSHCLCPHRGVLGHRRGTLGEATRQPHPSTQRGPRSP